MKSSMKRSILFLSLLTLGTTAFAGGLLPAGSNDLVPSALANGATSVNPVGSGEELHYAWRNEGSISAQAPYQAQSREYWADYTAAQLSSGIRLHTTAPAAVIRISPMQGTRAAIQPADISVQRNGQRYANASALTSVADAADIAEGMPDFPDGTTAFRLRADLGSGDFDLSAPVSDGRYLVHVYEPDSREVLKLQSAADAALSGQSLTLKASYENARGVAAADRVAGVLTSPDGRSFDLSFTRQRDGSYSSSLPAPTGANTDGPELWEVHTFASAGSVKRDAKTAIAITTPVARLNGETNQLALRAHGTNVVVQFGVDAAVAARLQMTGTLWGTDSKGALIPVANAQTAKTLASGQEGFLELRFMTDVVDSAGVRAPFEIRDLRLQNQANMGLLERRERAWTSN